MPVSKYQKAKIEDEQKKAYLMYKQGLTLREVAKIVNRSHNWVWLAVRAMEPNKERDKI